MKLGYKMKPFICKKKELFINQIKNLISELDNTKKNEEQGAHFYSLLSVAMKEVRIVAPSNVDLITEVDDSLASASGEFQEYELRSIISNLATNALQWWKLFG